MKNTASPGWDCMGRHSAGGPGDTGSPCPGSSRPPHLQRHLRNKEDGTQIIESEQLRNQSGDFPARSASHPLGAAHTHTLAAARSPLAVPVLVKR